MAFHVVILGNGIAGITAARFIRKRRHDARITVVSAETDHFFSRTALMYIYMGHMTYADTKPYEDDFWAKNRIDLVRAYAETVDVERKRLILRDAEPLAYDKLLLATGSASNRFGWPGQDLRGVQGLYSYPDLEQMGRDTEGIDRAVVVGGGLIGIEMAEMLRSRQIPVTFLVRERSCMNHILPPEESDLVNAEIRDHDGIDLRLDTELEAIHGDADGRVRSVTTKDGEEIDCQFVGLTVGVHPRLEVVRDTPIEHERGILVNAHLETSVPDIYAAGDCVQFRDPSVGHRPIEQLWYTGRRQGKAVAASICGERTTYDRGVFFNSAKFFTVEYQTYGQVPPVLPDDQETLCWMHPTERRLIRITYRREDQRVTGFNLMGVRYRHAVCEAWLRQERTLPYVLAHLGAANFDPEFFDRFEAEVRRQYHHRYPDQPLDAPASASSGGFWRRLFGRRDANGAAANDTAASDAAGNGRDASTAASTETRSTSTV